MSYQLVKSRTSPCSLHLEMPQVMGYPMNFLPIKGTYFRHVNPIPFLITHKKRCQCMWTTSLQKKKGIISLSCKQLALFFQKLPRNVTAANLERSEKRVPNLVFHQLLLVSCGHRNGGPYARIGTILNINQRWQRNRHFKMEIQLVIATSIFESATSLLL